MNLIDLLTPDPDTLRKITNMDLYGNYSLPSTYSLKEDEFSNKVKIQQPPDQKKSQKQLLEDYKRPNSSVFFQRTKGGLFYLIPEKDIGFSNSYMDITGQELVVEPIRTFLDIDRLPTIRNLRSLLFRESKGQHNYLTYIHRIFADREFEGFRAFMTIIYGQGTNDLSEHSGVLAADIELKNEDNYSFRLDLSRTFTEPEITFSGNLYRPKKMDIPLPKKFFNPKYDLETTPRNYPHIFVELMKKIKDKTLKKEDLPYQKGRLILTGSETDLPLNLEF